MAVQFVFGRSGTGKTSYCINAIADELANSKEDQSLVLLVPEQATYQAERAILNDDRIAGFNRLKILSFERLQYLLLGKNNAKPGISRIARQMIIHRILRQNADRLEMLASSADKPGLANRIEQTICELLRYAKMPEDIDELLAELEKDSTSKLTGMKFSDLGLIYKAYLEFINNKFVDSDVQLNLAGAAVADAKLLKGCKLWVDGFAGFTTAEFLVLAELLKAASDSKIAMCLDASDIDLENPETVSLFNPTLRTYSELVEMIKTCRLKTEKPVILERCVRFSACKNLGHVEQNIFEPNQAEMSASKNIRIISAQDRRGEVEFVAREIADLLRDKDFRYRDIAVIASEIDSYEHYILAYFADYGIAFFIDKPKPLSRHPVIEFICSALAIVTEGFGNNDIFSYLKTDLVGVSRSDVDLLENYCVAFGIGTDDWQSKKQWNFAGKENSQFDQKRISQIRQNVVGNLLELRDKLCPKSNEPTTIDAGQFTRIVFEFLEKFKICEKITAMIEDAWQRGDFEAAHEHRQFYDKLVDVFDEFVEVFGGEQLSGSDCFSILKSAFSQLKMAFIPPRLDEVLVGSIERSRHPDLKAVFLLGTTQSQFPAGLHAGTILTEQDRDIIESADFKLSDNLSTTLSDRQYLAYIAFTRASEFLYVTYPLADNDGSDIVRSQFISDLQSLFENLAAESIGQRSVSPEKIKTKSELGNLLCQRLGKDSSRDTAEKFCSLLEDVRADSDLAEIGEMVSSAISYDNRAQLSGDVVKQLTAKQISTSATRLQTFAQCPYKYFARYSLKLQQREEFKMRPLEIGDFYHDVLERFFNELISVEKELTEISNEKLLQILNKQISKILTEDSFIGGFAKRTLHNKFIVDSACGVLEDFVLADIEIIGAGKFRPAFTEMQLKALGEYKIKLSDGRTLILKGKIDRIDIAQIDGEKAVLIFDYKKTSRSFDWQEFYYGLNVQLAAYMLAAQSVSKMKIAGAFYLPIEKKPDKGSLAKLGQANGKFQYKAKGIFDGTFSGELDSGNTSNSKYYNFQVTKDGQPYGSYHNRGALKPTDFENILKFTEQRIIKSAEALIAGKIDVKPYRLNQKSPCSNCEYKPVCRFDWQINDYNHLTKTGKKKILEDLGSTDG
jgi:ATP-dependent helicase/nuclease subunit B